MISEFKDLSDKIDRLAELTLSLRRENAQLRQANVALGNEIGQLRQSNELLANENTTYMERLGQAQQRVEALLAAIPAGDEETAS
ncbi:hypothetical protein [Pseudoduganella sp. GCM10020061]|jgi:cell division protein ZapB|uniref:hypothetical protein n=1 Tax=Pseudoduganella sp. GCM10020061 TaxID=3317345 RepID=UPI003634355D